VRCYSADVDVYAIEDVYDHDMLGVVPLPVVVGVVPDVGVVPVGVAGVGVAAGGGGATFVHGPPVAVVHAPCMWSPGKAPGAGPPGVPGAGAGAGTASHEIW